MPAPILVHSHSTAPRRRPLAIPPFAAALVIVAMLACAPSGDDSETSPPTTAPATAPPVATDVAATPVPRAIAPAFELPAVGGGSVSLTQILEGRTAATLIFYRGLFCVRCQNQLSQLAQMRQQFEERNVALAAISVDNIEDAKKMAEMVGAEFYVLSDVDAQTTRAYGVFDLHDDDVAAPATFIIDPNGRIVSMRVGRDIADRPTPEQTLAELDRIFR